MGFPIRTSPDQSLVSGSPTLFAATHVLLRLLSPRHPSCALSSLVISLPCSFTFSRRPGSSAAPWLTGNPPDDTSCLPTCAYAVVKDRKSWWSRSGSNRRHPACKAGALPAELRPRTERGTRIAAPPAHHVPGATPVPAAAAHRVAWWAWVDLNYRPHAYQACALTS